ncbi:RagB/SusD family nutrient uptake outer membrane protein [Paludibacter jiangxiensis]|uniref:Starch-binding associating with outer membrane n=1 Tax=Paludibacter jiangxiensis TaxID=681398 RepID=A0A161LI40_9BACT|nr:RagB/SusD family nutrient uptake outer membrane protein [Paludibacter jiangxiensis]GAT61976.1 starch-binding associating with outer membrane [Paludibacter jiangxiensis]
MKKKLIYTLLTACTLATTMTSCKDFLEVSSPSVVDAAFVYKDLSTAEAAMAGLRDKWRECSGSYVYGAGAFYALDVPGSDIERHPESYSGQLQRHYPEGFYENGTKIATFCSTYSIDQADGKNTYTYLYATIMLANNAISAIEARSDYKTIIDSKTPSAWGFLYGQAVAARAQCYLDLTRYYGDVPYLTQGGQNVSGLTPRDVIYEGEIAKLKLVEPLMYRPGEIDSKGAAVGKGVFTRTFVQGLIGRMCLYAGGYATRRNDMKYVDAAGNSLSFDKIGADNNGSFYGRRQDYKQFFTTAKTYLDAAVANPGSAVIFHATDTRGTDALGRIYNNPYQLFFQQLGDNVGSTKNADESIYEIPMTRGVSNERPYSSGRVSDGGSTNQYPCKGYGQARIQPAYYYGWFDNNDMRRDVTVTVTGSNGKGVEKLIPFTPGSKASGGGLCLNKFDENRQASPYTASQRNSGINAPFMRISDIMLLDAEVNAVLDANSTVAYNLLKKVHERAFASAALANVDGFISAAGSLYKAIIKERALEFGGEGDRRNVLLRTGLIAEAVAQTRATNTAMVNALADNNKLAYTFANGNTISAYIWTATGDLKTAKGYRLTTQCPDETNPYLFPGWRGQFDSWETLGAAAISGNKTNVAIKGLFSQWTPAKVKITYADNTTATVSGMTFLTMMQKMKDGSAKSIVEQDSGLGMALTAWGSQIASNGPEFYQNFFPGFDGATAPIYFYPINSNTVNSSNGTITNGYGFVQQ